MSENTLPKKAPRNYSIEFWRFIFTIGVAMAHFQRAVTSVGEAPGVVTLFRTGRFINFFMIVTGFFMVDNYKKRKARKDPALENPAKAAWEYLKGRYVALWPAFFAGNLLGYVLICIASEDITTIGQALRFFGEQVYTFAGLEVTGITKNVATLNGATWYMSSIFVLSMPLYYFLCKNDRAYTVFCWIAWVIIIGHTANSEALGTIGMWAKNVQMFGIETSMLVSLGWFCFGSLLWYPVQWVKKAQLSSFQKNVIAVVEVLLTLAFIKGVFYESFYRDETLTFFFMAFFFVIMITGVGPVNSALAKVEFFKVLGKFSVYMYVVHFPIITFLRAIQPASMRMENYYLWQVIYAGLMIGVGFVIKLLTEKCIRPLFGKLFEYKVSE